MVDSLKFRKLLNNYLRKGIFVMKQSDLTKMITKNDVIDMKHKMDKTQDTSKPYAVIDNDNIAVVGDANEIQKLKKTM